MKKSTTTKKIKLFPLGDKEEINRVFEYIRNGQYVQYQIMNLLMSEIGSLYFQCGRDFNSEEFQSGYRRIFKADNPIFDDYELPVGADLKSLVVRAVQSDFSTALKNGLARGDRSLPTYRRGMPMFVKGRNIRFSLTEIEQKDIYVLSWVNKIQFKVITGSRGKNNELLIDLLDKLANNDEKYKVCGSQISVEDKDIYLSLVVQKDVDEVQYKPVKERVMGVAFGYSKPLCCAFSDSNELHFIEPEVDYVKKRQSLQAQYSRLQSSSKECKGGRGKKHKLASLNRFKNKEKNFVSYYNHLLSKAIVDYAVEMKVSCIVLEDITKDTLKSLPVLLRNWSYFQLMNYVTYKANEYGIKVIKGVTESLSCCKCGSMLKKEDIVPKEIVWTQNISFTCSCCNNQIDYSYNKARNISVLG